MEMHGLAAPAVAAYRDLRSLWRLSIVYEHKSQPLLHWPHFLHRLARSAALGSLLIAGSLLLGMWGYHALESLDWIDSYENAAMILSGMGPLHTPKTYAGKLFAGVMRFTAVLRCS
jgi:hypothetical protein